MSFVMPARAIYQFIKFYGVVYHILIHNTLINCNGCVKFLFLKSVIFEYELDRKKIHPYCYFRYV